MGHDMLKDYDGAVLHESYLGQDYAVFIPIVVKGLLSTDPDFRQASYGELHKTLFDESDRFNAATQVVPLLLEVLQYDIHDSRASAYKLLLKITVESASYLNKSDVEDITLLSNCQVCQKDIRTSLDIFLKDIGDPEASCRSESLDLVCELARIERQSGSDSIDKQLLQVYSSMSVGKRLIRWH